MLLYQQRQVHAASLTVMLASPASSAAFQASDFFHKKMWTTPVDIWGLYKATASAGGCQKKQCWFAKEKPCVFDCMRNGKAGGQYEVVNSAVRAEAGCLGARCLKHVQRKWLPLTAAALRRSQVLQTPLLQGLQKQHGLTQMPCA